MFHAKKAATWAVLLGLIAVFPAPQGATSPHQVWIPPQTMAFSTYLGGEEGEGAVAIAQMPDRGLVVAGTTQSLFFPTENAFQPDFGGGFRDLAYDGFLTAYSPLGTSRFSTYVGGSDVEFVRGLAAAPDGIWIAGGTGSSDFPVVGNVSYSGGGFVAKFSPAGALLFSTHFCGEGRVDALAADSQGDAWVACLTRSSGLPVVHGFQRDLAGNADGFIAELSPSGNLLYSTYVGGTGDEYLRAIAVHGDDVAFGGTTSSTDLPVKNAFQARSAGGSPDSYHATPFEPRADGFVGSIHAGRLQYLTYLGGSRADIVEALAYDENSVLFATGTTLSEDFWQIGAPPPANSGGGDVFLSELDAVGNMVFSSRIGGSEDDVGYGISVDHEEVHVAGSTYSPSLPHTVLLTRDSFILPEPALWTFVREDLAHPLAEVIGGSRLPSGLTYLVDGNAAGVAAIDPDSVAVAGTTFLLDFPVVDATQPYYGGAYENYDDYQTFGDAFVAKLRTCGLSPCTGANLTGTQGMGGWWVSNVSASFEPACLCDVSTTKYQLDGGPLASAAHASITGDGVHALQYHSVATTGATEPTAFLEIRIDTTPPGVRIAAPSEGTVTVNSDTVTLPSATVGGTQAALHTAIVTGTIAVSADAFDATSGVQSVAIRVDGTPLGTLTKAPYELRWDTSRWPFGAHTLTAEATDVAGNVASTSENVTVLSTVPPTAPGPLA